MPRLERSQQGFTLIEVVVAIAVVALGMMAVFRVVHDTVNNSVYLRDRTLATWIADNRLTEFRLATELPSVDETQGDVEFANQSWTWMATVSQTPVDDIRRIDVRVRRSTDPEASALAEVSGFVGAVALDTPPSGTSWAGAAGGGQGNDDGDEDADGAQPPASPGVPRPRRDRAPRDVDEDAE